MFITIDPYYDTQFYNQCKEALANNGVPYHEYILSIPPYNFYFDVLNPPTFINYDTIANQHVKWLVNIVKALKPSDDYIYARRDSFVNTDALHQYAVNDALRSAEKTGEGIFFTGTREEILRISSLYPRKIYYMGRYFNRKYKVFFTDNLLVMNLLRPDQILVQSKKFKSVTELEVDLNWGIFHGKDRLVKISETPFILGGAYYAQQLSVRPDLTDKYVLT